MKRTPKKPERIFDETELAIQKNLKTIREESGLTQEAFAGKYGVGISYVKGYESGRFVPSYMLLMRIADDTGLSLDWIFGRTKIRAMAKKGE